MSILKGIVTVWYLETFEGFDELIHSEFNLAEDFSYKRAGQISTGMVWDSSCPTVRVAVLDMAPFLAHRFESYLPEQSVHRLEIDDRQPGQTATSICWSPMNVGRSSVEPSNSSRQSVKTSLRFS